MIGRATKGVGAAAVAALALAIPGGAFAGSPGPTDTIVALSEFSYGGGTGDGTVFRLNAGGTSMLANADPAQGIQHNVVSTEDGPDGRPLFISDLIGPGASAPVEGTEYLQPGSYAFLCSIHQFAGMSGTIQVSGAGAVARPDVDVDIASSKLKQLKKGKLSVVVRAATAGDDISVEASVGGKPAGSAEGIDLGPAQKRKLTLNLGKQAKKAVKKGLKKGKKVAVSAESEVPWGAPDSDSAKLR